MVTILIRFCLILMLGALSGQALAMNMTDDNAPCSSHADVADRLSQSPQPARVSAHSDIDLHSADTVHTTCCKQDCQCPAGTCAAFTLLHSISELKRLSTQRKANTIARFMLPSLSVSTLFRPPIVA